MHRQSKGKCKCVTLRGPAFLVALGCLFAVLTHPALAQPRVCHCEFAQPPWEAFGTNALCTAYTRKGKTSCEIEFAGLSTDRKLAAEVLGLDQSPKQTIDVLSAYLQYLRDDRKKELADPKFLSTALPMFMRGAYLRAPSAKGLEKEEIGQLRALDFSIKTFFDKFSTQVSDVFLGNTKDFSVGIGGAKFQVGKGYIVVDHPAGRLVTRYMPAE